MDAKRPKEDSYDPTMLPTEQWERMGEWFGCKVQRRSTAWWMSVLENAALMGVKLPEKIRKALETLRDQEDKPSDKNE